MLLHEIRAIYDRISLLSWNLSSLKLVKHHLLDSPTKPDYATKHCKGKLHYAVETSNFCFFFVNSLIALYL